MAEYIKRSDVIDKMNEVAFEYLEDNSIQCSLAAGVVIDIRDTIVEAIPAADVAEVRHGRWMYDTADGVYVCNICDNAESITSHYCRYCGAKMDGRGNNDG